MIRVLPLTRMACVGALACLVGCKPPTMPGSLDKTSSAPSAPAVAPSPGGGPTLAPPTGTKTGAKTAISVQLSAGVALPQTLPDGVGMAFSCDYRFTQRDNDRSIRYFWVIVPAQGERIVKEVSLDQSGTLQVIVPGLRPEQGPYETRLEAQHPADPRRINVTGLVPMK